MKMNSTPRYIVAKYVPEPHRMEPRNIGVIVWHRGHVESRFVDQATNFLNEPEGFAYWRDFWIGLTQQDSIRTRQDACVRRADETFLDALRTKQDEQYLLVDGGFLTDRVAIRELPQVADFLFEDLVATRSAVRPVATVEARAALSRVLADSGCADRLIRHYSVECDVFGVQRKLQFTYGAGNGTPDAVLQRVNLAQDRSVHDAALKIHSVTYGSALLERRRCAALVFSPDHQNRTAVETNRRLMERLCDVVDLADHERAVHAIRTVVM